MNKLVTPALLTLLTTLLVAGAARAHCEIPCGIYDDEARIKLLEEHVSTIEKSMAQVRELSRQKTRDENQLVRWVVNKEHHADELQHIVAQYFMTQRIKPDAKDYQKKLVVLHKMLLAAMKCKQTTDPAHVQELRTLIKEFRVLYLG